MLIVSKNAALINSYYASSSDIIIIIVSIKKCSIMHAFLFEILV